MVAEHGKFNIGRKVSILSIGTVEPVSCEITQLEDFEQPTPLLQQWWNYTRTETFLIYKNILVLSIGFFFIFLQCGLGYLQTSINPEFGTFSMMATYVSGCLSSLFLPTFMIRKLNCKWALIICSFGYLPWVLAQLNQDHYLLIIAATIMGVFSAPMWIAKSTYITCIGRYHEIQRKKKPDVLIVKFFGIFFFIFMCGLLSGNALSSTSK